MKAVQVRPGSGMTLRDVPVPTPGPGEVLVKVAGAGLCHSEIAVAQYPQYYRPDESWMTLGHETSGYVESVGEGVSGLASGQPVVVHAEWGCGQCVSCRSGHERFCPVVRPRAGSGLGFDGGLAEYILVPSARNVLPLPEELDPTDAAPLDDAGLTPYHAIRSSMPWLDAGSVAVVIGVGGLGHMAVQLLREMSPAQIVVVEKDPRRRDFALDLGAHIALDPNDDAAAQIKAMGSDGASFVLDLVGNDKTLEMAGASAAVRGKVAVVGAGFGSLNFNMMSFPWECVLQTSYSGEAWELEQLLQLAAMGRIKVWANHITLDEVPAAYEQLGQGGLELGRTIAVPKG
ncbi:propanol-preferring alcohol dehydrogenase [Paenarthrobacter nitroguajacolicus]|uniref:alcohol dehydrogenase catalytic domain-containing protein n=1 Tax=Paenarthrobacter nitroguajacolicus TaxID=211146 RepID=UPI00285F5C6B|nr:alcohol dehydrogenase catalytic domain-containing protein [Paenarthrobacter nitroguajacolicus]MDR6989187.1 propanol-preferring alcohol dehydrogenase [Paenarthrobacter nitroguajacolicus]